MEKRVLEINGVAKTVFVEPETSLLQVLREQLLMTAVKMAVIKGTAVPAPLF